LRTCLEDGTVRWRLYNLWVTRPTYLGSVYCSVSFALESIKELFILFGTKNTFSFFFFRTLFSDSVDRRVEVRRRGRGNGSRGGGMGESLMFFVNA